VTLGHSFGAQVLLKAVTGSLEDQLQRLNPQPAYLRGARPATPDPGQTFTLSGVGDLPVLSRAIRANAGTSVPAT
jgi:hypothetical protein